MGRMWSVVVAAVAVLALVVAGVALLRDDDGWMPHRDAEAWSMGGGTGYGAGGGMAGAWTTAVLREPMSDGWRAARAPLSTM